MPNYQLMCDVAAKFNAGMTFAEIGKCYRKSPGWPCSVLNAAREAGIPVKREISAPRPEHPRPNPSPEIAIRMVGGIPVSLPRLRCLERA